MVVWEMTVWACGASLHWVVSFRISLWKFVAQSASTCIMQGGGGNFCCFLNLAGKVLTVTKPAFSEILKLG